MGFGLGLPPRLALSRGAHLLDLAPLLLPRAPRLGRLRVRVRVRLGLGLGLGYG